MKGCIARCIARLHRSPIRIRLDGHCNEIHTNDAYFLSANVTAMDNLASHLLAERKGQGPFVSNTHVPVCAYAVFEYIDADAEDCPEELWIISRQHGVPMVTKWFTNQSA